MPEKQTIQRARRAKEQGKRPTTQAGEFVREEMHHIRKGEHGAKSPRQAIAIGLSKARRAGVALPPPGEGKAKRKTSAAKRGATASKRSGAKQLKRTAAAGKRSSSTSRTRGTGRTGRGRTSSTSRGTSSRRGGTSRTGASRKSRGRS